MGRRMASSLRFRRRCGKAHKARFDARWISPQCDGARWGHACARADVEDATMQRALHAVALLASFGQPGPSVRARGIGHEDLITDPEHCKLSRPRPRNAQRNAFEDG